MKKNMTPFFTSFFFVSILISSANAQNTSPFWSLAGNNNAAATSKLGTTNSIPLNLTTNNATRIKVFEDGRVGVGGQITSTNATRVLNLADANAVMRILRVHTTNAPAIELISRTSANGANVAYWDMYAEPSDKSFRIRDRVTGDNLDRLTITKTGDVGIGTTTPHYQLHVEGGTATAAVYGKTAGPYGLYGVGKTYGVYGDGGLYGVYGNGPTYGVYGNSTGSGVYGAGGSYGIEGYAPGGLGYGYGVYGHSSYTGVTGSGGSYGVSGYCTSTSSGFGVFGHATDNATGVGVYGEGYYGVKAISNTTYGVDATGHFVGVVGHGSSTNSTSIGTEGYGESQGWGGYFSGGHIGVQGYAFTNSSSNYGVYGSGNGSAYAGYFNGALFATSYSGSDRKLKKNIEDVSKALNIINQLHPKVYEFRQDGGYQYMHLPEGKHYGLIAQELEQILPTLVKDTRFDTRVELQAQAKARANGAPDSRTVDVKGEVIDFKAVNYTELIPILVKSTQEMDKRVQDVEAENNALKQEVAELRQMVLALNGNNQAFGSAAHLSQNTPNPAKGAARISYSLPEGSNRAQLQITDNLGRTIRVVQLTGSGITNIDVTSLSAGVYNYSLVVDNKTIQTKKMTVIK